MGKRDRFDLVGNTIAGTFRVDELVAEGGFGVVYRAFHLHFRSPVALKCLKVPEELTDEERHEFLEQFRSEAEIMFRLSTTLPNVVRPLHVDAVETSSGEFVPLMALEWLDGKSFEKIIEERSLEGKAPMSLSEAVELITPAAQTLDAAHHFHGHQESMAVVHRDIKPDNLFLTEVAGQPQVKILDFGISKVRRAITELAGHVSQTSGQAPFSPAYGSPEQWVPKRYGQTGPWTDVWGLALTLVEITKGGAVIVGDHQAMMGTALDPHVRPTPRTEGVDVCDEVERVFKKALAADPRFRYQTVKSFWEALQHAIVVGGDPTVADASEGGTRIALPPMSAPTPWTNPPLSESTLNAEEHGLPPMLDPAPLEKSQPEDLALDASFPNDPESGLAPLLPAAHPDGAADFQVPQLDEEPAPNETAEELFPTRRASSAHPLELQPISGFPPSFAPLELAEEPAASREPELLLELATDELTPAYPTAGAGLHVPLHPIMPSRAPSSPAHSPTAHYPEALYPATHYSTPHYVDPSYQEESTIAPLPLGQEASTVPGQALPALDLPLLEETSDPGARAGAPARRVVMRKDSSPGMPSVPDLTPPIASRPGQVRGVAPTKGAPGGKGAPQAKGAQLRGAGAARGAHQPKGSHPAKVASNASGGRVGIGKVALNKVAKWPAASATTNQADPDPRSDDRGEVGSPMADNFSRPPPPRRAPAGPQPSAKSTPQTKSSALPDQTRTKTGSSQP